MAPEIGHPAPDVALKDQHGQLLSLADFRGQQNVALVFFPFAFSGLCTGELCEIRDNLSVFTDADVQVVAISCDPMYSLRAFADAEKYDFPLVSDFWPHGAVAQAYGVFAEGPGRAERATFLVDREGVLRWKVVNGPGEPRPISAYREAVAGL
jgi:mycoredoxin-dependent peroxiredoxin